MEVLSEGPLEAVLTTPPTARPMRTAPLLDGRRTGRMPLGRRRERWTGGGRRAGRSCADSAGSAARRHRCRRAPWTTATQTATCATSCTSSPRQRARCGLVTDPAPATNARGCGFLGSTTLARTTWPTTPTCADRSGERWVAPRTHACLLRRRTFGLVRSDGRRGLAAAERARQHEPGQGPHQRRAHAAQGLPRRALPHRSPPMLMASPCL